jgi:hypothetical protein
MLRRLLAIASLVALSFLVGPYAGSATAVPLLVSDVAEHGTPVSAALRHRTNSDELDWGRVLRVFPSEQECKTVQAQRPGTTCIYVVNVNAFVLYDGPDPNGA